MPQEQSAPAAQQETHRHTNARGVVQDESFLDFVRFAADVASTKFDDACNALDEMVFGPSGPAAATVETTAAAATANAIVKHQHRATDDHSGGVTDMGKHRQRRRGKQAEEQQPKHQQPNDQQPQEQQPNDQPPQDQQSQEQQANGTANPRPSRLEPEEGEIGLSGVSIAELGSALTRALSKSQPQPQPEQQAQAPAEFLKRMADLLEEARHKVEQGRQLANKKPGEQAAAPGQSEAGTSAATNSENPELKYEAGEWQLTRQRREDFERPGDGYIAPASSPVPLSLAEIDAPYLVQVRAKAVSEFAEYDKKCTERDSSRTTYLASWVGLDLKTAAERAEQKQSANTKVTTATTLADLKQALRQHITDSKLVATDGLYIALNNIITECDSQAGLRDQQARANAQAFAAAAEHTAALLDGAGIQDPERYQPSKYSLRRV